MKDNIPDWKVQTNEWNVEDTGQWKTEDTDNFFYEIEEKKKWERFVLSANTIVIVVVNAINVVVTYVTILR